MFLRKKKLLLKKRIESIPNEEKSNKKQNTAEAPKGVKKKKKNKSKNKIFAYGIIVIIVAIVMLVSAAAFLKNGSIAHKKATHKKAKSAASSTNYTGRTKTQTDKAKDEVKEDGFVSMTGYSNNAKTSKTLTLDSTDTMDTMDTTGVTDATKPSAAENNSHPAVSENDKLAKAENIFGNMKRKSGTQPAEPVSSKEERKHVAKHDKVAETKHEAHIIVCSLRSEVRHTDAALLNIFVKRNDGSFDYKEDYATIDEVEILKFAGKETGIFDNAKETFYVRMKKPGYIMEKQLKAGYSCQK